MPNSFVSAADKGPRTCTAAPATTPESVEAEALATLAHAQRQFVNIAEVLAKGEWVERVRKREAGGRGWSCCCCNITRVADAVP